MPLSSASSCDSIDVVGVRTTPRMASACARTWSRSSWYREPVGGVDVPVSMIACWSEAVRVAPAQFKRSMETVGRGYLARHGAREERYNELVAKAKSLPEHSSSWKATVADAARVVAEERRDSGRPLKGNAGHLRRD